MGFAIPAAFECLSKMSNLFLSKPPGFRYDRGLDYLNPLKKGSSSMSKYYDAERIKELVASDRHRVVIGGLWEELGTLQLNCLQHLGMKPSSSVLDVGCGSLRLGAKLVDFLDPGQYYGTDLNLPLLDAGYERELSEQLRTKLPRENLIEHDATQALPIEMSFDFIVAFSLFTHLHPDQCLSVLRSISQCMHPQSTVMATFFVTDHNPHLPSEQSAGITTYPDRDPFHLSQEQITSLGGKVGLVLRPIDGFSHPRNQRLFKIKQN
ncbi:MAG: class I SAM-dependent methyltransferase [Henriciella sp.]